MDTSSSESSALGAAQKRLGARRRQRVGWILAASGAAGLVAAIALRHSAATAAADQDWPPFVLVLGLLLVGLVANDDGVFAQAGRRLAHGAPNGAVLFGGAAVMVALVTAVLNLDTSVAFLTPVLVYTARSWGGGEVPLVCGCLLLSNAGSLFLPGSNLTNLIVLGQSHLRGAAFLSRTWAAGLSALVVTAVVIAAFDHRALRSRAAVAPEPDPPVFGLGLLGVVAVGVVVVALPSPALPVAGIGLAVIGIRFARARVQLSRVIDVLGLPVLVGLYEVAVALGTLGRSWSGPATLLSRLDVWGTAALAAVSSVLLNNLPAASLLAARPPAHPVALLIGLNIGPNLFVTGSLAWFLWMRAAHAAGSRPQVARTSSIGAVAVPLSLAAAVAAIVATRP
jgi:arsenical pump membrane protein